MARTTLEKVNDCLAEIAHVLRSLREELPDRSIYSERASELFLKHLEGKHAALSIGLIRLQSHEQLPFYSKCIVYIDTQPNSLEIEPFSLYYSFLKQYPALIIFDPIMNVDGIDMKKNQLVAFFTRARINAIKTHELDSPLPLSPTITPTSLTPNSQTSSLHSSFFPSTTSCTQAPRGQSFSPEDRHIHSEEGGLQSMGSSHRN